MGRFVDFKLRKNYALVVREKRSSQSLVNTVKAHKQLTNLIIY